MNDQLVIEKPVIYVAKIFSSLFIRSVSSAYRNRSQSTACGIWLIDSKNGPKMHLYSAVAENLS